MLGWSAAPGRLWLFVHAFRKRTQDIDHWRKAGQAEMTVMQSWLLPSDKNAFIGVTSVLP
jgi:hypothetical protein